MPVEVNRELSVSISEGAERIISVDCTPDLDADEDIATVDTVTEVGIMTGRDADGQIVATASTDLTLANKQPNSTTLTIQNRSVPAGKAFMFTVEGQEKPNTYVVRVTYTTDKVTPIPQVNVVDVLLPCV